MGKGYGGSCSKKDYQGCVVVRHCYRGVLKGLKSKSIERVTTTSIIHLQ